MATSSMYMLLVLLVLTMVDSISLFPLSDDRHATAAAAYCTNSDLSMKLQPISAPVHGADNPRQNTKTWHINIDDSKAGYKQTITGFGATITDGTVSTFNSLSSSKLDALLSSLMTSSGAAFSMMRHTIGSSDLSSTATTYDDNGGKPDTNFTNFALGSQGTSMAQLLAKTIAKNSQTQVIGSPWSAPGWMKTNGVLIGNSTSNNLKTGYLDPNQTDHSSHFAQYFVKYILAFAAHGVNVDAITIQNEPLMSPPGYPSMYMYDYEQADLIQLHVGPALIHSGLRTSIWAYDHNTDVPSYPQTVIDGARQYTDTVAWHCYAGNLDWTAMSDFHAANPGVTQYMSECWTPAVDSRDWFQAANFTIGPLQNWASGVMAWNLGSDPSHGPRLAGGCSSCRGLVTIHSDGSYQFNIAYYLMAQFSKFIPRGAIVLKGTGSSLNPNTPGIQFIATTNPDDTSSVVVMNTLTEDVYVKVTLTGTGQQWSGIVPASSVVTWVLQARWHRQNSLSSTRSARKPLILTIAWAVVCWCLSTILS